MKKSLALLIFALLCCEDNLDVVMYSTRGVDSVSLKDEDFEMADKFFTLGADAFLKYLDNFKTAAETVMTEKKINKTGTDMQDLWVSLKKMIEIINVEEKAKGNDNFIVALKVFMNIAQVLRDGYYRLGRTFNYPREFGFYRGIIKNETVVELWKFVESRYLPGAPAFYENPIGFNTYLLSKIMTRPPVVQMLRFAAEVWKTDIEQLFDDIQNTIQLFREKINEIHTLEKQKEKDEFLITLRTASGVIAFYWDKLVEFTESQPFHDKYLAALRRWKELRELKDTKKYHMITNPETRLQAWTWADERFSDLFDNAALEYDQWGNGIFGDERFNQSNCAIMKMATVYPLPIYESFSENGIGMSEVNDFLIDTDDTLTELLGEDFLTNLKSVISELWNIFSNEILHVSINKKTQLTSEYEDPLKYLHKIKATCFDIWDRLLFEINKNINNDGLEQSARHWEEVKSVFFKELTDNGEISQEKIDEAKKAFNSVTQTVFDKYVKMVDGLEDRIGASAETLGKVMLKTFSTTNTVLVNTFAFVLSD